MGQNPFNSNKDKEKIGEKIMTGVIEKIKNFFGKKEEPRQAVRLGSKNLTEQMGGQEFVPRYKLAKKMREDKDMAQPILKRKRY